MDSGAGAHQAACQRSNHLGARYCRRFPETFTFLLLTSEAAVALAAPAKAKET
jgi:hypothetical protein